MLTVRRLYFYGVAAISLIAVTWCVIGLAWLVINEGIGQGQIFGLASFLAAIIVGLPIFLFHWLMAQRYAANEVDERASLVRRFYLYGVMLVGAVAIFNNLYQLLDQLLVALVGGRQFAEFGLAEHLIAAVIWGVIWFYLWREVQSDNRHITLEDGHRTIRRLYLLLLAAGGLVMATFGAFGLLQSLLQLASTSLLPTAMANRSSLLLAGSAIWVAHWWLLQQEMAKSHPAEERSVLRKVYLYGAVFIYAVMAVFGLSTVLKRLIELGLGGSPSTEPLLSQLSIPVPLIIAGGVWWAYHWQVLHHDANRAPEAPRQASVRRIYAYLVAAIGLATLLSGLTGLFSTIIELLTKADAIGLDYYRGQVALFSAMTLVGVPIWLRPWRRMQQAALAESTQGEAGSAERRSTMRKIYLYFYVFVASLAIFGSAGWFVYHILTALLGADLPDDFLTQVLIALVITLLAVGVWLYHGWAIRRDGQLQKSDQAARFADAMVVVIDGAEGKLGQAVLHELERNLPGLRPKTVGLTPQAATALGAPDLANEVGELITTADYIIGAWPSLNTAEVAPWVNSSKATKVALPLTESKWAWAGVHPQPLEYYARQAALGVKQALAGEEISPSREFDLGTIALIIVGILVFLIVLGGVIGLMGFFF
jgi:hypothetical protein